MNLTLDEVIHRLKSKNLKWKLYKGCVRAEIPYDGLACPISALSPDPQPAVKFHQVAGDMKFEWHFRYIIWKTADNLRESYHFSPVLRKKLLKELGIKKHWWQFWIR